MHIALWQMSNLFYCSGLEDVAAAHFDAILYKPALLQPKG
jgi:hypothetical protein